MMLKEKKKKHRESGLCSSKCLRVRLLKKKIMTGYFRQEEMLCMLASGKHWPVHAHISCY